MRGAVSRYFFGSLSCQTFGGSTVWSSTEMIFGKVVVGSVALVSKVSMSATVALI